MSREIEWIKKSVRLCMNASINEQAKKIEFSELERWYFEFTEEEQVNIRKIIVTQFEEKDSIYILSSFIQNMKKIEEFKDDILEITGRADINSNLSAMLELQENIYIDNHYAAKKKLHKKNIDKFRKSLDMREHKYHSLEERNRKRIVIITDQMLTLQHAPTRIVFSMIDILQEKLGYEVLLFVCPEDMILPMDVWCGKAGAMRSQEQFLSKAIKIKYHDTIINGYQIGLSHQACEKEYNMMLDLIYAWNPLFVFEIGAGNPIADLTGNYTTLVNMGMSSNCPISEADILIRDGQRNEKIEKETADALGKNQIQIFLQETMPICIEKNVNHFTRKELKLPENKFLIAIVGNRLDQEIDDRFVDVMLEILKRNDNVAFVIIGTVVAVKQYFEEDSFRGKIFYLGYCKDLMGAYEVMDLYLNPKRIGGGFSSIMALMAGVPVVTLPDCDVAVCVGENFIVDDYEKMKIVTERYIKDRKFYDNQVLLAKNHTEKNTEQGMEKYVRNIIDNVIEIMERREKNDII